MKRAVYVLTERGKAVAYSFDRKHLERVARFHGLGGKIAVTDRLPELPDLGRYRFDEVYRELIKIPAGKTVTYGELAKRTGLHVRQVVYALKFNPFPLLIPCHRVVAKNGIGGYTPLGKEFKARLLEQEKNRSEQKGL